MHRVNEVPFNQFCNNSANAIGMHAMHLVTMAMDGISGSNESRVKPDRLKLQAQYNYSSLTLPWIYKIIYFMMSLSINQ